MLSSMVHSASTFKFDDYNFQRTPYHTYVAYGSSKTATTWMANEIERRYGSQGLHATSVHPGAVLTEKLSAQVDEAQGMMQNPAIALYMKSIAQGAATPVWAAVGKEWETKGGRYLAEMIEQGPLRGSESDLIQHGYAPHAYDKEGEERLWDLGLQLCSTAEK
ncbi:putative short-chain dehydrogenase [Ilyonectria robusta]